MSIPRARALVVVLVALITASGASAMAQAQPPPSTGIGPLNFSGTFRTRAEAWQWFEGEANSDYAYSGSILRLSLGQQKRALDWQIEMAAPFLLGLPDDAIAPGAQGQLGLGAAYFGANDRSRNAAMLFPKQAFVRFKSLGGNGAHGIRLGRFEFVEGTEATPKNPTLAAVKRDRLAHRLIGHFGWSHVGRSFDGLSYVYNTERNNFTFLGARPTRGVFQVDGWGGLDIGVFFGAFTRPVGGKQSAGEFRLFGIYYHDWRENVLKTDNRPAGVRRLDAGNVRIATAGGHYLHALETPRGTVDFLLWGAFQTGRWGVQDHRAFAATLEAGYQPNASWLKPWFRAGFHHGSGDSDPGDNKHATFFQVLPTPRWLARFPFYNLMNIQDAYGQVMVRPGPRWNLRTDLHALRLASRHDLWYQGGGAFQPWTFGYAGRPGNGRRGMATVLDISADYRVNANVSLGAYFANAWGRRLMESIYPKGGTARLAYLELTSRF